MLAIRSSVLQDAATVPLMLVAMRPWQHLLLLLLLLLLFFKGAWVYEDVNSDDYDTDNGYTPAPPGPLNPASGLLTGLNRALGRGGVQGSGAAGEQGSGDVYYPPQQELPPVAGGQQQQQGGSRRGVAAMGEGGPGSSHRLAVMPGVTKSGPGLLHGDRISLQSLLQVRS